MKKDSAIRILRDYGIVVIVVLLLSFFIKTVAFEIYLISHISMKPALIPGDTVIIEKFGFSGVNESNYKEKVSVGDVILFEENRGSRRFFLRRILGLPGDRIQLVEGRVFRNGQALAVPVLNSEVALEGRSEGRNLDDPCVIEKSEDRRWTVCFTPPLPKNMTEFTVNSGEVFVLPDLRTIEESDATVFGVVPPPVVAQFEEIEGAAFRIFLSFDQTKSPRVRWDRIGKLVP